MSTYELIASITVLLLFLLSERKSSDLPVFFTAYVSLNAFQIGFLEELSIALNAMFFSRYLKKHEHRKPESEQGLNSIIRKNRKKFPFHDNVEIALSRTPYVYMYLKEGTCIRLRCSLKELLSVKLNLKKVARNVAISSNVKVIDKDRFTVNDQEITLQMIVSMQNHSSDEYDS